MTTRVLIVEPQQQAREGLAELLREDGYEVRTAATGRQAMEILRAFRADWVLTEMELPDMGGAWLTCTVTSWPRPPRVLCMSARDTGRSCCAEVLAKPIDYNGLVARLRAGAQSATIAA